MIAAMFISYAVRLFLCLLSLGKTYCNLNSAMQFSAYVLIYDWKYVEVLQSLQTNCRANLKENFIVSSDEVTGAVVIIQLKFNYNFSHIFNFNFCHILLFLLCCIILERFSYWLARNLKKLMLSFNILLHRLEHLVQ